MDKKAGLKMVFKLEMALIPALKRAGILKTLYRYNIFLKLSIRRH